MSICTHTFVVRRATLDLALVMFDVHSLLLWCGVVQTHIWIYLVGKMKLRQFAGSVHLTGAGTRYINLASVVKWGGSCKSC